MKDETSTVLDARRLVLRQAIAHYHRMNPMSSRTDIVNELLDESVSILVEKLKSEPSDLGDPSDESRYLSNLSRFLFGIFKNKLRNFRRKKSEEDIAHYPDELSDHGSFAEHIDRRILVSEIVRGFNGEERYIFDRILLGYTFDEIAVEFSEKSGKPTSAVALRVRFHRAVARLARV
jgi:hypothetical protein